MRSFIVMAMFVASLTHAAMNGYTETRYLELDTDDIEVLSIDAGAGSMDIKGIAGASAISVKAVIEISDTNVDEAMKIIERNMTLSLEQKGTVAHLKAWFEHGFLNFGSDDGRIDIEVKVTQCIAVKIDDGSGSIDVSHVSGDVSIIDGSGSINVRGVQGSVTIDDGSGSIKISDVEEDLIITGDGSGGLTYSDIRGTVQEDT